MLGAELIILVQMLKEFGNTGIGKDWDWPLRLTRHP